MYDVIIIGVDVFDAASARELSWCKVNVCVLGREEDVCCGTSKTNNAIVHAGYDAVEGSLMARLNVEGNQIMPELARELDFPFNPRESFVVRLDEEPLSGLRASYERGAKNGVKDLEITTDKVRIKEMESNLADEMAGVLYAPTAGTVCPFDPNIALAENIYTNGADFKLNTEVTDIRRIKGGWAPEANQGVYETRYVVNAVGVHADESHNMVNGTKMHITPKRGDYCLLDKSVGNHVSRTTSILPGKYGKGALISLTVHGNLVVGPTAIDIEDRETMATTRGGLDELIAKVGTNVKDLPMRQVITPFAGPRVHEDHHEFIIKELEDAPGFVDCAGVESPGLTSCPVIGGMVVRTPREKLELEPNMQFNDGRKGILDSDTLTKEEQAELIRQNPAYGDIICRCEMITKGEILDAVHRPLGARSLGGIKRRTRAGMGRCQAGFCTPRSIELLHRELGLPIMEITEAGGDSKFVMEINEDRI